ncbi:TetR/AcrR family transcriptional regulator [Clostridium arbusti]|uniref:TetR/AcrR family transcriptional regulator n=1 Tax=Clostridium arbusti TaxID=1137848 RepID=UPI00028A2856|nr:TetR/AcrR family transcriptional regulator [Clostridium arbusti]
MGIKERREKEKIELRNKIISAAEELFAEAGYQNISMRKIANKIEYSLPTIYQFFKNKGDILFYIYNKNNGKLLYIFQEISNKECNAVEKLKNMSHAYVDFALKNPNYYELAYMSNALRYEENLVYNDKGSSGFRAYDMLLNTVKDCKEQGYFKEKDFEVITQCLWAGIHGLTSLFIAHNEFPWKDKELLIENMIDSLIKS